VSRLVIIGGLPIAVRVLIADAARDGCVAVLSRSDHAAPRSRRHDPLAPLILRFHPDGGGAAPAVSIESRL
jgi:hypothetical protein